MSHDSVPNRVLQWVLPRQSWLLFWCWAVWSRVLQLEPFVFKQEFILVPVPEYLSDSLSKNTCLLTPLLSCSFHSTFQVLETTYNSETHKPHFWSLPAITTIWNNCTLCTVHTFFSDSLCQNPVSRCFYLPDLLETLWWSHSEATVYHALYILSSCLLCCQFQKEEQLL